LVWSGWMKCGWRWVVGYDSPLMNRWVKQSEGQAGMVGLTERCVRDVGIHTKANSNDGLDGWMDGKGGMCVCVCNEWQGVGD
jgi:hypothetical protein